MNNHIVTCARMKELERLTDESGLSYYEMMENAGTCAAAAILGTSGCKRGDAAVVFCGKGNNGGDGFVVARLLSEQGIAVTVILVDGQPKTPDAITNFELLAKMPVSIVDMTKDLSACVKLLKDVLPSSGGSAADGSGEEVEPTNPESSEANSRSADDKKYSPAVVVDAIYGTGFHGELRPRAAAATDYITMHRDIAFALDIPSGLTGDMKAGDRYNKDSARVAVTITFHARKPVHAVEIVKDYCGEIVVADIGIRE